MICYIPQINVCDFLCHNAIYSANKFNQGNKMLTMRNGWMTDGSIWI